jgi:hypothetical protein
MGLSRIVRFTIREYKKKQISEEEKNISSEKEREMISEERKSINSVGLLSIAKIITA